MATCTLQIRSAFEIDVMTFIEVNGVRRIRLDEVKTRASPDFVEKLSKNISVNSFKAKQQSSVWDFLNYRYFHQETF